MSVVPRLADVKCSRIVFQPGDRVLVRCYHKMEPEQRKHLYRSVQRFCGEDVEVLIYNPFDFDLEIEHRGNIID